MEIRSNYYPNSYMVHRDRPCDESQDESSNKGKREKHLKMITDIILECDDDDIRDMLAPVQATMRSRLPRGWK